MQNFSYISAINIVRQHSSRKMDCRFTPKRHSKLTLNKKGPRYYSRLKEHSAISSQLQLQETEPETTTTHFQECENTISPSQGGTGNISETLEIDS